MLAIKDRLTSLARDVNLSFVKRTALRRRYGHMAPAFRLPGPFKAHFVTKDCDEPPHVHLKGRGEAKVWIESAEVEWAFMSSTERRQARAYVKKHKTALLEGWHEHCD